MGSPTFPSLFQLSRCPLSLTLTSIPRFSAAAFCPLGTKRGMGRRLHGLRLVAGCVWVRLKGIARFLGTWRERLTWRRLRGEGSALQELHCEHKAKAEGEGRDQANAPTGFPRPPPKKKKRKSSHTHRVLDSIFSHSRSHREVYLQANLLFYAFSPGRYINSVLEEPVCLCVEKGSW